MITIYEYRGVTAVEKNGLICVTEDATSDMVALTTDIGVAVREFVAAVQGRR